MSVLRAVSHPSLPAPTAVVLSPCLPPSIFSLLWWLLLILIGYLGVCCLKSTYLVISQFFLSFDFKFHSMGPEDTFWMPAVLGNTRLTVWPSGCPALGTALGRSCVLHGGVRRGQAVSSVMSPVLVIFSSVSYPRWKVGC